MKANDSDQHEASALSLPLSTYSPSSSCTSRTTTASNYRRRCLPRRNKHYHRAAFRSISLISLVMGYIAYDKFLGNANYNMSHRTRNENSEHGAAVGALPDIALRESGIGSIILSKYKNVFGGTTTSPNPQQEQQHLGSGQFDHESAVSEVRFASEQRNKFYGRSHRRAQQGEDTMEALSSESSVAMNNSAGAEAGASENSNSTNITTVVVDIIGTQEESSQNDTAKFSNETTDSFPNETISSEMDMYGSRFSQSTSSSNATQTPCSEIEKARPTWFLVWYILGALYMFLALAIVCDEFFVPALEEMADTDHLNLSMDVAGATLMAAGGSAPELFTSLFGTFRGSEIGFGTIVGSAVFNVLFVIACCSFLAKEVLQLTWWPLFRDCICYVVGLVMLAVFVGVISPGKILLWEACVLFVMYLGYVTIMYFNERLHLLITKRELYREDDAAAESSGGAEMVVMNGDEGSSPNGGAAVESAAAAGQNTDETANTTANEHGIGPKRTSSLRIGPDPWPGTFRAGVLKLLRDPNSWSRTAGVGIVSQIEGDVDAVFRKIDANGNGVIDREELRVLFEQLDCHIPEDQLDGVVAELDCNADGAISEEEFIRWYVKSEERILSRVRHLFEMFDSDCSGTIDRSELRQLLETIEPRVTDQDIEDAVTAMYQSGSREEITYEEFSEWYKDSLIYNRCQTQLEEELGGVFEFARPPKGGGCCDYTRWLLVLPILLALTVTVPDVRVIHWGKFGRCRGKFCYLAFFISILWIGVFSYFMVDWTEIIGNTIGIPSVVMGYTFLAAGTSVPDLLSSVVVARKGEGDMAVSSSIGSNIFDILVGLPIPWILYTAWPSLPSYIAIGSDGVWVSIFVLLAMVVMVILSIHCQGWKLTKPLGIFMFVLYGAFLVQAIWMELPFPTCDPSKRR